MYIYKLTVVLSFFTLTTDFTTLFRNKRGDIRVRVFENHSTRFMIFSKGKEQVAIFSGRSSRKNKTCPFSMIPSMSNVRSRKKMRQKIIVSVWNIYQCSVRSSKSVKVEHEFSYGCRQYKQHRSNKMIESKNRSEWVHFWRYPHSFAVLLHRTVTELTITSVTLPRPSNKLMVEKWAHSPLLTHRTRQSSRNRSRARIYLTFLAFFRTFGALNALQTSSRSLKSKAGEVGCSNSAILFCSVASQEHLSSKLMSPINSLFLRKITQ